MSFYNPYSSKPDYGQGIQDIISQIMQMMMMKKAFPGQKESIGQTPTLPAPQMSPMGTTAEKLNVPGMQPGPGQMGEQGYLPPDLLQKIMAMLMQTGGMGRGM